MADKHMNRLLAFDYTNWRGDDHYYIVEPESIGVGQHIAEDEGKVVLNAFIVARDGDIRKEMGKVRRRTFVVEKLRNLVEIP